MSDDSSIHYVVGGQQKRSETLPGDESSRFSKGIIATYRENHERGKLNVEYITPPDLCPDSDSKSILFKSGTVSEGKLYACTQTEVLIYSLPEFATIGHISLPCFNDVHHVVPSPNGTLLVAVTGLDMVIEVTLDGEVVNEWDVLGREPWTKFSKEIDYRKVLTTKPHESHPNFVFHTGDDVWVTRFRQRDSICLTTPGRRIEIGVEKPHDGYVYGDKVYFTTVDGHVVVANLKTDKVERVLDLHSFDPDKSHTGWSRGLKVIDDEHIIVGFSTLRVTKFRENVRWVKSRFGLLGDSKPTPTHISMYNIKEKKLCWRRVLDDPCLDVIFSVL